MLIAKTILFKFKILIKVSLKYKLQSEQVVRIWIDIECLFWEKVKGKKECFQMRKDFVKKGLS
jgi:hypothetical protein